MAGLGKVRPITEYILTERRPIDTSIRGIPYRMSNLTDDRGRANGRPVS